MLNEKQFSREYYVYELIDPRTNEAFYIGKGKGDRMYNHVSDVKNSRSINEKKTKTILEIIEAGMQVGYNVVKSGLLEKEAFILESKLIKENRSKLTNISGGSNKNFYRDWALNMLKTTKQPDGTDELHSRIYDELLRMSASCFSISGFTETINKDGRHIQYHYQ